jgi:hypothetical protein
MEYFGTFAAFVAGVVTFTEFFKKIFNVTKKGWMIAISWIISIVGAIAGFYFQLGFLTEYGTPDMWQGWVMAGVTGIGAGVASNGLYDQTIVEKIVEWIWSFIKPKQQVVNE